VSPAVRAVVIALIALIAVALWVYQAQTGGAR
jgi:hypothetical protein